MAFVILELTKIQSSPLGVVETIAIEFTCLELSLVVLSSFIEIGTEPMAFFGDFPSKIIHSMIVFLSYQAVHFTFSELAHPLVRFVSQLANSMHHISFKLSHINGAIF